MEWYLIRTYTNTGDTVLDQLYGQRDNGRARCVRTRGGLAIGIEIEEEKYCEIAAKRLAADGAGSYGVCMKGSHVYKSLLFGKGTLSDGMYIIEKMKDQLGGGR